MIVWFWTVGGVTEVGYGCVKLNALELRFPAISKGIFAEFPRLTVTLGDGLLTNYQVGPQVSTNAPKVLSN